MRLLTVTNLYPRPDQPQRGMFNLQLFRELHGQLTGRGGGITNICLVPSWQPWRWNAIARWRNPHPTGYDTLYLPVLYVPVLGRGYNWQYCLNALERASVAAEQVDGVFAPWLYPDGVGAASFASLHRLPCWIMALGSDVMNFDDGTRRKAILRACDYARAVLCVCQSLKDRMIRCEVDTDKISVVPNGVDTKMFAYSPPEQAAGRVGELRPLSSPAGKTVLFVGNLARVKGPDILLHAWQQYKEARDAGRQMSDVRERRLAEIHDIWDEDYVDTSKPEGPEGACSGTSGHGAPDRPTLRRKDNLVLIGKGPMLPYLRYLVRSLNIEDSVRFIGSVCHDEVAAWMNTADVLCLPSRSEGMPNVVLEALACGLPVVASDVGACREMLSASPESQIVPSDAPGPLAEAIEKALTREVNRKSMSERYANARSWADQARQILAIMESGK